MPFAVTEEEVSDEPLPGSFQIEPPQVLQAL